MLIGLEVHIFDEECKNVQFVDTIPTNKKPHIKTRSLVIISVKRSRKSEDEIYES